MLSHSRCSAAGPRLGERLAQLGHRVLLLLEVNRQKIARGGVAVGVGPADPLLIKTFELRGSLAAFGLAGQDVSDQRDGVGELLLAAEPDGPGGLNASKGMPCFDRLRLVQQRCAKNSHGASELLGLLEFGSAS